MTNIKNSLWTEPLNHAAACGLCGVDCSTFQFKLFPGKFVTFHINSTFENGSQSCAGGGRYQIFKFSNFYTLLHRSFSQYVSSFRPSAYPFGLLHLVSKLYILHFFSVFFATCRLVRLRLPYYDYIYNIHTSTSKCTLVTVIESQKLC